MISYPWEWAQFRASAGYRVARKAWRCDAAPAWIWWDSDRGLMRSVYGRPSEPWDPHEIDKRAVDWICLDNGRQLRLFP